MPVDETIESFEKLVDGELDDIPEQAFFNVGGVESVLEKAKSLQREAAEPMPLHVEVVSPESILYEGEADMVVCRPTDGEIAFLPGHAPFVGALETYAGARPPARAGRGRGRGARRVRRGAATTR